MTELGWRSRARAAARTIDAPPWLADVLGAAPESTRGHRRWRTAAAQIEAYRDRYHITEPGLGPTPTTIWPNCATGGTANALSTASTRAPATVTSNGASTRVAGCRCNPNRVRLS